MGIAISTVEGWCSQHMVFSMDFSASIVLKQRRRLRPRGELEAFLAELESMHQAREAVTF